MVECHLPKVKVASSSLVTRSIIHPRRTIMRKLLRRFGYPFSILSIFQALAREARLVRYPHYHDGRIVF